MLVQRGSAAAPSPRLPAWLSVGVLGLVRALVQGLRRDPAVLHRTPTVEQLRLAYFAALDAYAAQMDLHPIARDPAMVGALDGAASAPGMPDDGRDERGDADEPDDGDAGDGHADADADAGAQPIGHHADRAHAAHRHSAQRRGVGEPVVSIGQPAHDQ